MARQAVVPLPLLPEAVHGARLRHSRRRRLPPPQAMSRAAPPPATAASRLRRRRHRPLSQASKPSRRAPTACPACGSKLLEGAVACMDCGYLLAADAAAGAERRAAEPLPQPGVRRRQPARRTQLPALRHAAADRAGHAAARPLSARQAPEDGRLRRRLHGRRHQGATTARSPIKDMIGNDPQEFAIRLNFFRREAEILRSLETVPIVPRVYDFIEQGQTAHLVMEFIRGKDLLDSWRRTATSRSRSTQVVEWGKAICDVLTHMHTQSPPLIHRDLKPDNIMLLEDQQLDQDDRLRHRPRPGPDRQGTQLPARRASTPRATPRRSRSSASRSRAAICSPWPRRCITWRPARRPRGSTPPRDRGRSSPTPARRIAGRAALVLRADQDQPGGGRQRPLLLGPGDQGRPGEAPGDEGDCLPEVQDDEQGPRAVLLEVRRAADRPDRRRAITAARQPHGQPVLHPLRQSAALTDFPPLPRSGAEGEGANIIPRIAVMSDSSSKLPKPARRGAAPRDEPLPAWDVSPPMALPVTLPADGNGGDIPMAIPLEPPAAGIPDTLPGEPPPLPEPPPVAESIEPPPVADRPIAAPADFPCPAVQRQPLSADYCSDCGYYFSPADRGTCALISRRTPRRRYSPSLYIRTIVNRRFKCGSGPVGERGDFCAGTLDAPRLHAVSQREEKGDGRTFRPLSDRRRAENAEADEHVHIEPQMPYRRQRPRPHRPQPGQRRRRIEGDGARIMCVSDKGLEPVVGGKPLDRPPDKKKSAGRGRPQRASTRHGDGDARACAAIRLLRPWRQWRAPQGRCREQCRQSPPRWYADSSNRTWTNPWMRSKSRAVMPGVELKARRIKAASSAQSMPCTWRRSSPIRVRARRSALPRCGRRP